MSRESLPTVNTAKKLGLTEDEFVKINDILGRTPNFTELSIFSVMWSEHCSYKNSIKWLKTLPRDGEHLLVEAGEENAGLVDIGNNMACAFKIESHNHPSAIEPYQGAATGVGGIHRDIFTMGARPIAALNSLRFGPPELPRTQHLVRGVVKGIGDYGNCLGVPTVGGEVYFDPCYTQNILVNAMSVGVVTVGETVSATAEGIGNPVLIVGSATGKDGIHGATFASADLTEDSAEDLPAVQVGDPFQEKLLLEASLEAIQTGALVGMQDMGAAGITCSTSEMSAKGGVGMRIQLDKVPTRQADMQPFEILLSESQERMLMVVEKGKEQLFYDIFDKWDLECEHIGEVTDTGRLEFFKGNEIVADVPADPLVLGGGAPVYEREYVRPGYMKNIESITQDQIPKDTDNVEVAKKIIQLPNIASKVWVYDQYDKTVRTNSVNTYTPSDASVIRLKNSEGGLAATVDCNSAYVYLNPEKGAEIAVAEAARNLVCSGAKPTAITNCLNFGNPYNPEVYYQFVHAIKGMGNACRTFNTPVTGGNVSFYNQTVLPDSTEPVYPTPTIGMLGVLKDMSQTITLDFKEEGDHIFILGPSHSHWSYCEYLRHLHGKKLCTVPELDLDTELRLHQLIHTLNGKGYIQSAHDISEGGLFVALAESGFASGRGFKIYTPNDQALNHFLYNEHQTRVVLTVSNGHVNEVQELCEQYDIPCMEIGQVIGDHFQINDEDYGYVKDWHSLYHNALGRIFDPESN